MTRADAPYRRRWLTADVVCLHCGRAIGLLVGPGAWAERSHGGLVLRPADHSRPTRRVAPGERLTCTGCGGPGVVGEMSEFTTYEEPLERIDEDAPRRRGRRPKPMRRVQDVRLAGLGLAS